MPTREPRIQLHQPLGRHQSKNHLDPGPALQGTCSSFQRSLTHQGSRQQPQENQSSSACVPGLPTSRPGPTLGSAMSRPIQASGCPRPCTQLYQELAPSTSNLTPALGPLGPATRLLDLDSTQQCASTSLRVTQDSAASCLLT